MAGERGVVEISRADSEAVDFGDDGAETKAQTTLSELNGESGDPVAFHEAPGYGDRFLYGQNYVHQEAGGHD